MEGGEGRFWGLGQSFDEGGEEGEESIDDFGRGREGERGDEGVAEVDEEAGLVGDVGG